MKIKSIKLKSFKRFTDLLVEGIQDTVKLVVLVGPNGSGKTSILEAINHFYKLRGHNDFGDYHYLRKCGSDEQLSDSEWGQCALDSVEIEFHDFSSSKKILDDEVKGHFYFRSAYRNEPDFAISRMEKQKDPTKTVRLSTLNQNDQTVSGNYQRLISESVSKLYNDNEGKKTLEQLRTELIGDICLAVSNIFKDLRLSSLGDPLVDGSFFFSKGVIEKFHYKNLSAGEKSAFDLILDLVVQSRYFSDAIYCIDEPEAHMHTNLQGKVLREMYQIIPDRSQLWLSTHSIGMLQEAEDIEKENPGKVAFLDFGECDFDSNQVICPSKIGRAITEKFYELAFGDFAKLMLPKTIVICEGDPNGSRCKDFDKSIYTKIFGDTHPDTSFISVGSCNDVVEFGIKQGGIVNTILKGSKIIKIIDRDDLSNQEVEEYHKNGIRVLSKRNIESYLLDDSVIRELCKKYGKEEKFSECIEAKKQAILKSVSRGNPPNDLKSAGGDIYNDLKRILCLTSRGNNVGSFLRDTMAPLIVEGMDIYNQLEEDIFGEPGT